MKINSIYNALSFPQLSSLTEDSNETSHVQLPQVHKKFVWIIIVFGLLLRLPLLLTPLTYASDGWRQADTASIAHNFINGFNLFYPQIHWGGNGPGFVETEFQLYPFIVAVLYTFFGEHLWLGRLVSLLFAGPTFILIYLLARRVLGYRPAIWALAFFVFTPLYIRYSVAFMPEATVLFFYIAALYLFQRWLDEQRLVILLAASISTALAILVKPTSIHIGLIFALLAIHRFGWRVIKRWDVWLAGVISLTPAVLYFLHASNLYQEYGNTFGLISGGDSKFGNLDYWLRLGFYVSLVRLDTKWIFAGMGLIIFLIGFILSLKERRNLLIIYGTGTIFIYYMIVARYAQVSWGIQYHIYAVPYAALGFAVGFDWLINYPRRVPAITTALLLGSLTLLGSAYIYQGMLGTKESELINCARSVKQLVPENARIIVSTISYAAVAGKPNNYEEPTIFFYSHRYGWSLPPEWHTPEKLRELHQAGATYFIIYSQDLYRSSPELSNYLDENSRQIGPGVELGCGIFQFNSTTPTG